MKTHTNHSGTWVSEPADDLAGRTTRPQARRPVGDLAPDRLEADLVELAGRLRTGTYELLVLVGEYDARGIWALRGALSCAAWLADLCDIEVSTARSQVRVARALRTYPVLDTAMRDGDVSYAKARVLVPYLDAENASELVELAETYPAGRLGAAIAARSQQVDDPNVIAARQCAARSCSWRTEPDGMVVITARLTPAAAGAVTAMIDAVVTTTSTSSTARTASRREIGDEVESDAEAEPKWPSLAQQRADALVTVVTQGVGKVDTEFVVHVTQDGNHLADGTPLPDHTVTRMLPDAFVSLLMHDTDRQPIDASPRRRFPTRRQTRVLDARQTECAQPGCHAHSFLQYDHIQPYTKGGPTTLANLQRLCGPHNRAKAA